MTTYYSIFMYIIVIYCAQVTPCVLLTVLSTLLIRAMRAANDARRRLKSRDTGDGRGVELGGSSPEHTRTTRMLVAVVLCFVAVELPQGVLALLSGIDNNFFHYVYVPLGIIALL